ncbi:MAG: hypothetical protein KC620_15290, partial [Myxococcales bacterium]|nr:hypothetical protein [Myxococcales bacterium]
MGRGLACGLAVLAVACASTDATDTPALDASTPDVFVPPLTDAEPPTPDGMVGDGPVDGPPIDPCAHDPCPVGQGCTAVGGVAECTPLDCATLECGPQERCEPVPEGGAICVDLSCVNDLSCPANEYCDGVCTPDVCAPGAPTCDGQSLMRCAENGSGFVEEAACFGDAEGYPGQCAPLGPGDAACLCRDEWDCPPYYACVGGACRGTGQAPTCSLPPVPFADSQPRPEIVWGGQADDIEAHGSPFPRSGQAVMTPVVANLDDDNGDGLIDERDFPEIIFMTFCDAADTGAGTPSHNRNGVLRAIFGGGPNKGADKFAVAGDLLWRFGEPLPDVNLRAQCDDGDIDPTSALAVGDLDDPATSDGRPEIVVVHDDNGVIIYDNTGARLTEGFIGLNLGGGNPAVGIANIDGQGPAEIIIGARVFTVARTPDGGMEIVDVFRGTLGDGTNGQGPVSCVADILGDSALEIIGGGTVYALPHPPAGATRQADCVANGGVIAPVGDEEIAWCNGDLRVIWDAQRVNPDTGSREGFCAVADILGADRAAPPGPDNPLDGAPEVILISAGHLQIYDGQTGTLYVDVPQQLGGNGGAPNVDDFDGDGFPEVGSAFATGYAMMDLQAPTEHCPAWPDLQVDDADPPEANAPRAPGGACQNDADCAAGEATCNARIGRCVCYHNGWRRQTEDDSSRVTGSTLFDFNGDGAAEVIYNDECWFRIYDGVDGNVLFKEPSESRTRIEHPIVADADNDGNAEIIFSASNESGFCSQRGQPAPPPYQGRIDDTYNNGLEMWGDPNDRWVSARRIWNQHAYHVTQVQESGRVPVPEPGSWLTYGDRRYNTYRSQPRTYGAAPDLTVVGVTVTAPGAGCSALTTAIEVNALIRNIGDVRVGPGVVVAFEGSWDGAPEPLRNAAGDPIEVPLVDSIEPGRDRRLAIDYDSSANGANPDRLPTSVRVVVDAGGDPDFGRERECHEDNNTATAVVETPPARPDLRMVAV